MIPRRRRPHYLLLSMVLDHPITNANLGIVFFCVSITKYQSHYIAPAVYGNTAVLGIRYLAYETRCFCCSSLIRLMKRSVRSRSRNGSLLSEPLRAYQTEIGTIELVPEQIGFTSDRQIDAFLHEAAALGCNR